jgi:elongation factor P
MRVKYRNLLTGNVIDKTFKSGESAETADVNHREMDFLYSDGETWNFMDPDNFDQLEVDSKIIGNAKKWLVGQERCEIVLWNDQPIIVEAPVFVNLVITTSEPGVRGDTVSGATKVAELETGVSIQVPLFVNEGETIKVDTRTETYVSRV